MEYSTTSATLLFFASSQASFLPSSSSSVFREKYRCKHSHHAGAPSGTSLFLLWDRKRQYMGVILNLKYWSNLNRCTEIWENV